MRPAPQEISAGSRSGCVMRPLRLRFTLGPKLGLAFAGVLAVMLASLAVVLVKASQASDAYKHALSWQTAIEGAAHQAAGTRQQQAAQALYVATGDARYKRQWEAGVTASERAGAGVEALHAPTITRIVAGATAADRKHDDTVHKQLFPAMARGDRAAAQAALALADRYVRVPLKAQVQVEIYVTGLQVLDMTKAEAAAASARRAGLLAGLLATVLAALIVFLVSRRIRGDVTQVLSRLSALERDDAAALQTA